MLDLLCLRFLRAYECESDRKRTLLWKKFKQLIRTREYSEDLAKKNVNEILNYVTNKSSLMFTEEEMQLLNKGWNYAIKPNFEQKIN